MIVILILRCISNIRITLLQYVIISPVSEIYVAVQSEVLVFLLDAGTGRQHGHSSLVDSCSGGSDLQPQDEWNSNRPAEGLSEPQHLPLLYSAHRHLLHVLHVTMDAGSRVQRFIREKNQVIFRSSVQLNHQISIFPISSSFEDVFQEFIFFLFVVSQFDVKFSNVVLRIYFCV